MNTKGKMIKWLKQNGIRKGDKDGATVSLEHLRTHQIATMFFNIYNFRTYEKQVLKLFIRINISNFII